MNNWIASKLTLLKAGRKCSSCKISRLVVGRKTSQGNFLVPAKLKVQHELASKSMIKLPRSLYSIILIDRVYSYLTLSSISLSLYHCLSHSFSSAVLVQSFHIPCGFFSVICVSFPVSEAKSINPPGFLFFGDVWNDEFPRIIFITRSFHSSFSLFHRFRRNLFLSCYSGAGVEDKTYY